VIFSGPTFNGARHYARVAFETGLPRVEATGLSPNSCQRFSPTGTGCVDPPNGARFHPIYVATQVGGACRWYLGGPNLPGTQNFWGSSTAEYGPLVRFDYPDPSGDLSCFDGFRNILPTNPCPS
jgi:hypothetical protein